MSESDYALSNHAIRPPALRRFKQAVGRMLIPTLPLRRHTFDHLRLELNALYVRFQNGFNPAYRYSKQRLRSATNVMVNIGCGGSGKPGWVNLDLMNHANLSLRYDCRTSLPLSAGVAQVIRCEHFLEHLDMVEEVPRLLESCYRVLSVGGTLRIVVPDARKYLLAYASNDAEHWQALGWDLEGLPQGFTPPLM